MQIIEKSIAGVRSAVYRLRRKRGEMEFVLFPMVHVGTQSFYDQVRKKLQECDYILAEGVNSKRVWLLASSYKIIRRVKRIDLVTQQEALKFSDLSSKVINADIDGATFDEQWSRLPVAVRMLLFSLLPFYMAYLFLFGTRETLAENLAMDDLPSRDEILDYDETFDKLDRLLIDDRDQAIIRHIESLLESGRSGTVGIVYGARHMRNLLRFLLDQKNYQIVDSEWIRVFDQ